jgi:hypothetical protein
MTEPTSLIAYQRAEREIVAEEVGWGFGFTWIRVRCSRSWRRTLEKCPAMIEPRSRSGALK